jgi:hypothetical protein
MLGRQALADAAAEGLIGLGRISADEAYFWPDIEGREAFILPVQEKGATVDLIAWSPKRPTDWRWRLGSATILNLDAVMVTSWDMPPVKVHATPLDWLRAGRDGCVILDWSSPDIGWLTSLPAIEAEPMINAKIKRAILAMRLPRFVAARRNHEHAA